VTSLPSSDVPSSSAGTTVGFTFSVPSPIVTGIATSPISRTTSSTTVASTSTEIAKPGIPRSAVVVGASVSAVSVVVIFLGLWVICWQVRVEKLRRHERREKRSGNRAGGHDENDRSPAVNGDNSGAILSENSDMRTRIADEPPTLPLPPHWPYQPAGEKSGWRNQYRHGSVGNGPRSTGLMDDTPYDVADADDARTVSTAVAEAGSAGPSVPSSRRTSRRVVPVPTLKYLLTPGSGSEGDQIRNSRRTSSYRSGMSSLWSWSHRATQSDSETLPAYTIRRSQSTSRSRRTSRMSSSRVAGSEANATLNYPIDLGRQIARLYSPRPPTSPLPPGYVQ